MARVPIAVSFVLAGLVVAGLAANDPQAGNRVGPRPPALAEGDTSELAAGKFLVASRNLHDTHFARTVVLLLNYDRDGAMGLIVNRRTPLRLSSVFPKFDDLDAGRHNVFEGGPVSRDSLLMLVRSAKDPGKTLHVFGDVHVSTNVDLLERLLGDRTNTTNFRVYSGYAGWAAGQLDGEVRRDDWHIVDAETAFVFDADPEKTWKQLLPRDPQRWTRLPVIPGRRLLACL